MDGSPEPALVLLGPTASGKTDVILEIAPELGAEVVSVDSRQVYRGMDVGTAKPTREERARVPHHLIDCAGPEEVYSAGRFRDEAVAAAAEIRARGRRPVFVGGTGLYFDALLRGLGPVPARDPAVRAELEELAAREGGGALHEELRRVDATSAARIHPNDRIRLVRALEIWRVAGRPPSELRRWRREREDAILVGLWWEKERLHRRIDERLLRMMRAGFPEEVSALCEAGFGEGAPGLRTQGYRELLHHLEGRLSLEAALQETARATRRLARRQIQWFRARPAVCWIDGSLPPRVLAVKVLDAWAAGLRGERTS